MKQIILGVIENKKLEFKIPIKIDSEKKTVFNTMVKQQYNYQKQLFADVLQNMCS